MSDQYTAVTEPPRSGLALGQTLVSGSAAALLYAPIVTLADGTNRSLMGLAGAWGMVSCVILGLLAVVAALLVAANRLTWVRLMVVDMLVLLALIPGIVGMSVAWDGLPSEVAALDWGLWGFVLLVLVRLPGSIWIRSGARAALTDDQRGQ